MCHKLPAGGNGFVILLTLAILFPLSGCVLLCWGFGLPFAPTGSFCDLTLAHVTCASYLLLRYDKTGTKQTKSLQTGALGEAPQAPVALHRLVTPSRHAD